MTIADWLMIVAVLSGPILAVQVSEMLAARKEIRQRQLDIFKTLMATRAYTTSQAHVEALNRIDLEFDHRRAKNRPVIDAWKAYLDLLGNSQLPADQWDVRRVDLLIDLLHAMGKVLDYDFDKTHIKNATYSPMVHGRIEQEQEAFRQGMIELLEGKRDLGIVLKGDGNNA